jgi:hypothetical protein
MLEEEILPYIVKPAVVDNTMTRNSFGIHYELNSNATQIQHRILQTITTYSICSAHNKYTEENKNTV